ncbi:MAG TPA: hypothetical protein VFL83_01905 [Anaeromyxobacter sp.]|nr:hypothetical protein [Anaeromyxobacter sp.]
MSGGRPPLARAVVARGSAALQPATIVGRSVTVFGRGLAPISLLASGVTAFLWVADRAFSPMLLGGALGGPAAEAVEIALWLALILFQGAAVTAIALRTIRGERAGAVRAAAIAARRLGAVVGASLLTAAAVVPGVAAFVAPGLAALASFAVAVPVAVDERGGPVRALLRSADLTRGRRLRVGAGLVLVAVLCSACVLLLWAGLFRIAPRTSWTGFAALLGLHALLALPAVAAAVVYEALRDAREAPERELERVFG